MQTKQIEAEKITVWASTPMPPTCDGPVMIRARLREAYVGNIAKRVWRAEINWVERTAADEGKETTPLLTLTNEQASDLMAQLWHCGIRPACLAEETVASLGTPAPRQPEPPPVASKVSRHLVALRLLDYLNKDEGTR